MSESTALLADFGGVLTTNVHDAFRAFSSQIGDDPELVLRLLSRDPGSSRLLAGNECGRLDDESFEHGFAARLAAHGVRVTARGLLMRMQSGFSADHEMLDALAALRAGGMPVALVTNSFGRDCYDGFDLHALADVASSPPMSACASRRGASTLSRASASGSHSPAASWSTTSSTTSRAPPRPGIADVLDTSAERTVRELDDRFGIRAAA